MPIYARVSTQGASFIYPPLATLPYRPLAGLPHGTAQLYLFWANRCLLVGIFVLLFLIARPFNPIGSWRLALGLLVTTTLWHPLMRAVELNQASVLVTFFLGASWAATRYGKQALAGILCALAVAIKPQLVLVIPLLYWHARRTAVVTGITSLILMCISLAYAGWDAHVQYLTRVLPSLLPGYAFYPNQSWNGLIGRLFFSEHAALFLIVPDDPLVRIAPAVLGTLTLLYFGVTIRALPRVAEMRVDVFGLSWLAATVASPIAWEHHFAPGLFCLGWLYRRISEASPQRQRSVEKPVMGLVVAAVLMGSYFEVRPLLHPLAMVLDSYVLAGALLLGYFWLALLKAQQTEQLSLPTRR